MFPSPSLVNPRICPDCTPKVNRSPTKVSSRDTLQSKVARACGGLLRSRTLWRVRSLRVACAPCPMRGARKTAPRIHAAEAGAGATANRRRSWPQHSRTPQARAPPRFRAWRENLRRIDSAAVLPPRRAAKENPARLQACGVYRWGGCGLLARVRAAMR